MVFVQKGVISTSANPQAGGPPLVVRNITIHIASVYIGATVCHPWKLPVARSWYSDTEKISDDYVNWVGKCSGYCTFRPLSLLINFPAVVIKFRIVKIHITYTELNEKER